MSIETFETRALLVYPVPAKKRTNYDDKHTCVVSLPVKPTFDDIASPFMTLQWTRIEHEVMGNLIIAFDFKAFTTRDRAETTNYNRVMDDFLEKHATIVGRRN